MNTNKRRNFIKNVLVGTTATIVAAKSHAKLSITPNEVEGPFYPIVPQDDKDADLTRVEGKSGVAKGQVIEVFGQVKDQYGKPVSNATLDIWQANSFGKYHHPHDQSTKQIDENFQAWAIIKCNDEGKYRIRTIIPGEYTIMGGRETRTPHIHFKVGRNGYEPLLTQMYFPNHPMNEQDILIRKKTKEQTALMTSTKIPATADKVEQYEFNLVMEKL